MPEQQDLLLGSEGGFPSIGPTYSFPLVSFVPHPGFQEASEGDDASRNKLPGQVPSLVRVYPRDEEN